MYRDPSEFRERFKAYKNGKSVREIYGLPGYEPGKLPVEEMMPYILAVENPTKQGLVNGVWRPPTDSTKWDVHAIGGGLDIREQHNPIVYNYLKTNGRLGSPFLTAKEEEILREKVFKKTMLPALQNVYNKYGDKISPKGYTRLAGMKWQGHPFLMAISPDSVTGKAFIKAIESGDKDLDSVFDAYYKYPANAKRYAARILADTNYWKNHNAVATKQVPQEPIIARLDATRVSTIPTIQLRAIDYSDRRNAVAADIDRTIWAHNVMEDMKGAYQVPIWESPSLPALTPVEYDVTPLKTYAGGKVAEQNEPVITQGRAGSRLEKFRRSMDPDENDGTVTRVLKGVGRGAADLALDFTRASGIETLDRFATRTQRPEDYIDAAFLTVGNAMISRMLKASSKTFMNLFIRTFNDMDARALGKYFFQEHPELMTKPQEAWYGELAKKSDSYFRLAIDHRVKMFDREGRPLSPESIAALISPDIKVAPIKGSRYGGIYSAPDNTMLVNSDLVKDPRTAAKVYNHERAHAMQTAFENEVGLPYPVRYGTEMEALFPFTAEQKAKRPGVHIGKEIDASLHEVKSLRSYDTNQLGRALDVDFENMSDKEFREYANNGYFKDIMQNILNGLQAQKKFIGKLKNGKLPGYKIGHNPSNAKINSDGTFTDDYTKLFDDIYITPKKVDLKYGSHTLNNFPEYLANRTAWMLTFMPPAVMNEKGLELPMIDPFLIALTGGKMAGDLIGDVMGIGIEKAAVSAAALAVKGAAKINTVKNVKTNPFKDTSATNFDLFNKMKRIEIRNKLQNIGGNNVRSTTNIKDVAKDPYITMLGRDLGKDVIHHKGMPEGVEDVFRYQIFPRTNISPMDYDNAIDMLSKYGYNTLDDYNWKKYVDKNFIGFRSDNNAIALNDAYIRQAAPHEFRHRMQSLIPDKKSLAIDRQSYLDRAYDDDFVNLPNIVDETDVLHGYTHMMDEKATTNLDSRQYAFSTFTDDYNLPKKSIIQLNKFIDSLSDDQIIECVENSNGYGKRFINFLRNNNKLLGKMKTLKAELFRRAMKYYGSFAVPIGLTYSIYNANK